jgi:phenolic acid decarboxylase
MKTNGMFAALAFLCVLSSSAIAAPTFEHYVFKYDEAHVYDVKLASDTITWEALSGAEKGQKETDRVNRKTLSNDVEVIQWTENDGTFVTLAFDRNNLTVVSSGKFASDMWLWSGIATKAG